MNKIKKVTRGTVIEMADGKQHDARTLERFRFWYDGPDQYNS